MFYIRSISLNIATIVINGCFLLTVQTLKEKGHARNNKYIDECMSFVLMSKQIFFQSSTLLRYILVLGVTQLVAYHNISGVFVYVCL